MGENCERLLLFSVSDTGHAMEMVNVDLQRKIIPAKSVVILVGVMWGKLLIVSTMLFWWKNWRHCCVIVFGLTVWFEDEFEFSDRIICECVFLFLTTLKKIVCDVKRHVLFTSDWRELVNNCFFCWNKKEKNYMISLFS